MTLSKMDSIIERNYQKRIVYAEMREGPLPRLASTRRARRGLCCTIETPVTAPPQCSGASSANPSFLIQQAAFNAKPYCCELCSADVTGRALEAVGSGDGDAARPNRPRPTMGQERGSPWVNEVKPKEIRATPGVGAERSPVGPLLMAVAVSGTGACTDSLPVGPGASASST